MSAGACGLRVAMLSDMRRSRSDTRSVKGLADTVVRVGFRHSAGSSQTYTSMSTLPSGGRGAAAEQQVAQAHDGGSA